MHLFPKNLYFLPKSTKERFSFMVNQKYVKKPLSKIFNITDVVTILCYELSPSFSTEGESHDFWEMVYVDRGHISCRADQSRRELFEGELIFHRPNAFHNVKCNGEESASVFIISFVCKSSAMKCFYNKVFKISSDQKNLIRRIISECNAAFSVSEYPLQKKRGAPIGSSQMIRNLLEELFICLLRDEEKKLPVRETKDGRATLDAPLAQSICDYLKERAYKRISIDEISKHFHYGKSSLCELFKRSTGETIMAYHARLKVEEAKRLIFERKLTVSEISERLSFESPEYFSRCFRRHTGMSPREFRKRLTSGSTVYLENEKMLDPSWQSSNEN